MQTKSKNKTLTIECSDWARDFAIRFLATGTELQFYAFKPNRTILAGAQFLGKFTDGNGELFQPDPDWQWHIAVEMNGLLHDEIHPNGVITQDYLRYFENIKYMSVTQHADLASAIKKARDRF